MTRLLTLTLLTLTSSVTLAQAAGTRASIFQLEINPAAQTLDLALQVDLGFPLGQRLSTVALNCAGSTAPKVDALKQTGLDQYDPDPAATTALLASGVVQAGTSAVTVKGTRGVLRFYCRDHLLVTDFTRIAADPAAQGTVDGDNPSFDLAQTSYMRSLKIRYPLVYTDIPANLLRASGLSIYLDSNGGFKGTRKTVQDISFDNVASKETRGAVFLLDDKKRELLPLKFAGNDAGVRKAVGLPVGPTLVLYYAPDYTSPTGWHQTTVDFTRSLIWTQPVPRPTLPISK